MAKIKHILIKEAALAEFNKAKATIMQFKTQEGLRVTDNYIIYKICEHFNQGCKNGNTEPAKPASAGAEAVEPGKANIN